MLVLPSQLLTVTHIMIIGLIHCLGIMVSGAGVVSKALLQSVIDLTIVESTENAGPENGGVKNE